ncbi:thioredoxin family protein [Rhodoflexus sp.]
MKSFLKNGILFISAVLLQVTSFAQGIAFTKGKWQEILAKAKAEDKPIFVDFYAEWCGPCKFMAKTVFTDAQVADYYNKNFISVKIDAEKEEPELVRASQIEAYPSLYYFSADGKIINKNIGALDKAEFIAFGKKVINGQIAAKEIPALKAMYEANPDDVLAARNYLLALARTNGGDAESKAVATAYLSKLTEQQLQEEDNWTIIQRFVTDSDSREFKYVLDNAKLFSEKYGKGLEAFVVQHMDAVLTAAVQQQNIGKADQVKHMYVNLMQATNPEARQAGFYEGIIDMFYYQGTENEAAYVKSLIDWMDQYNSEDRDELMRRSMELASRSKEANPLAKAREWSAKALKMGEDAIAYYVHAFVLEQSGDKTNAKAFAEKGLKQNPEEELEAYLQELIDRVK